MISIGRMRVMNKQKKKNHRFLSFFLCYFLLLVIETEYVGRRLLVTKVQIENLVVGWYHSNFVAPIAIHSQRHKTN